MSDLKQAFFNEIAEVRGSVYVDIIGDQLVIDGQLDLYSLISISRAFHRYLTGGEEIK